MKLNPFCLTSASRATTLVALFVLSLSAMMSPIANAKPPILEQPTGFQYPTQVLKGSTQQFEIAYLQEAGDKPRSLQLIIETPQGGVSKVLPTDQPTGDLATGPLVATWYFVPADTGNYKYHFEAVSTTGESARFPLTPTEDEQFTAESLVTKYVILIVGVIVSMGFLPFLVYIGTRSMNKRSDPGTAARVAIIVGALAAYSLYIYLFNWVYSPVMNVIVAVALAAILTVLFTRRR